MQRAVGHHEALTQECRVWARAGSCRRWRRPRSAAPPMAIETEAPASFRRVVPYRHHGHDRTAGGERAYARQRSAARSQATSQCRDSAPTRRAPPVRDRREQQNFLPLSFERVHERAPVAATRRRR